MIITNVANPLFSRLCRHLEQEAAASQPTAAGQDVYEML